MLLITWWGINLTANLLFMKDLGFSKRASLQNGKQSRHELETRDRYPPDIKSTSLHWSQWSCNWFTPTEDWVHQVWTRHQLFIYCNKSHWVFARLVIFCLSRSQYYRCSGSRRTAAGNCQWFISVLTCFLQCLVTFFIAGDSNIAGGGFSSSSYLSQDRVNKL